MEQKGNKKRNTNTKNTKTQSDKMKKTTENNSSQNKDGNVSFYGKIAKFPKNVKASNAYNFLENVKIPKNKIWYILVENQDNNLQMIKYNTKKGVNMVQFVNDLKSYYLNKFQEHEKLPEILEQIEVDGDENTSTIKNIPKVKIAEKQLISRITEDMIKLLAK